MLKREILENFLDVREKYSSEKLPLLSGYFQASIKTVVPNFSNSINVELKQSLVHRRIIKRSREKGQGNSLPLVKSIGKRWPCQIQFTLLRWKNECFS